MLTVIGVLVAVVVGVWLSTRFWLAVPLLTLSQGPQELCGEVTRIEKLPGGVIEVGLTQRFAIEPGPNKEGITLISASGTSFVHFRTGGNIPQLGALVEAQTTNRLYPLQGRSLNWVLSWKHVEDVGTGGVVRRVADPALVLG